MSDRDVIKISISSDADIVLVRKAARDFAVAIGFGVTDVARIVTAASELARNVVLYAETGDVILQKLERDGKVGLQMTFMDQGPGIPDIEQALTPGYTTSGGLGLGLPGAKRLMDEMEIVSEVGRGTTVTVRKWLRKL